MAWLRNNAVALLGMAVGGIFGAGVAYAATEARISDVEEEVKKIDRMGDNVLILCTHLAAPCKD